MHQSISAAFGAPPPSRATAGHFAHLVSPRDGALANLAQPGSQALANPGNTPKIFVRFFKLGRDKK